MRDIGIVKYRKLLYNLQQFCKNNKLHLWREFVFPNKKILTDFERGYIAGQHAAYNRVLKETHFMIECADYDWHSVHCREEKKSD